MGESIIDCDRIPTMPNVSFTIGDKIFNLSPEQVSFMWCVPLVDFNFLLVIINFAAPAAPKL